MLHVELCSSALCCAGVWMERRTSTSTREEQRRRRRSMSGWEVVRRASTIGQTAGLEVQKAEMEAKIARELQAVAVVQPVFFSRSVDTTDGPSREASPSPTHAHAMDRATTPEERLRAAAAWGHDAVLRELLENSALDLDAADAANGYCWTAFHLACINGQADAVEQLVRAGCDTTQVIAGGVEQTGVQYAQNLGQQEVLDRLGQLAAEGCGGEGLAKQLARLAASKIAEAGIETTGGAGNRRTGVSAESTAVMLQGQERQAPAMATAAVADEQAIEKSEEQLTRISAAVGSNLLFANLEAEAYREVFDLLVERRFEAGVDVVIQGDHGDFFYIIDRGEVEVLTDGSSVTTLGAGESFGELALMYSAPRSATVRTTQPTVCWALDRLAFRTALFGEHREQTETIKEFLAAVPLLQPLSPRELTKVVDAVTSRRVAAGDDIIVAGTRGEALFILRSGTAVAIQPPMMRGQDGLADSPTTEQELRTYSTPGDFFGELALLTRTRVGLDGVPVWCDESNSVRLGVWTYRHAAQRNREGSHRCGGAIARARSLHEDGW